MNKSYRQAQILKLIRERAISTQEQLAQELASAGVRATQVTLSRDIRELGLAKTAAVPRVGSIGTEARVRRCCRGVFTMCVLPRTWSC
jgi:predicted DNA-binding transcriptional regulator YafY